MPRLCLFRFFLLKIVNTIGLGRKRQRTMGVPYSGGFREKIGSVFHYFSLGGLPLWGSKTGSKHPKTGLI